MNHEKWLESVRSEYGVETAASCRAILFEADKKKKEADRRKAIELIIADLKLTNGNGWFSIAEDLYDKGYRKFEIVEEDV
jgi:Tfp pilus assembly protein PilF